ncbi:unnamed protein product [Heterobilharzia americana]|nr:unnamed protein product [Heterobilharzia americana]
MQSPHIRKTKAVTRRSSFTVRRDEILRSKLNDLLSSDPVNPSENHQMCSNRQAQASAKLRRGNYDLLNYAPQDQIVGVTSNTDVSKNETYRSVYTSNRAKIMVSTALSTCVTSKRKSIDELAVNIPSGLSKRNKLNNSCLFNSDNVNISVTDKKPNPISTEIRLNTEELSALDDVLNELVVQTSSTSGCISREHESAPLKSAQTPKDDEQKTHIHEHDEPLEALNLSDWSPGKDEPVKVDKQCTVNDQLSQIPNQSFVRGNVLEINQKRDETELLIQVYNNDNNCSTSELKIILRDSWLDSPIRKNDVINVIPDILVDKRISVKSTSVFIVSDHNNPVGCAVCLHPDYLLPTTKVVGSLNCLRRAVLEQFWVSDGGYGDNEISATNQNQTNSYGPEIMLTGSLVHELFQKIISNKIIRRDIISQIISDLIHRSSTVLQMYIYGIKVKLLLTKLDEFVPKIMKWIQTHCTWHQPPGVRPIHANQVKVDDVIAIEENIWSSRLGLKGKIDLTLLCQIPLNGELKPTLNVIPMELKTGNPSYSIEHKGQVYLYLLLAKEFYGKFYDTSKYLNVPVANAGWLVYLQEAVNESCQKQKSYTNASIVYPDITSYHGLIQTRNQLVSGIIDLLKSTETFHSNENLHADNWKPELPDRINQLRMCQTCGVQLTCSLFEKNPVKSYTSSCDSALNVPKFLINRRSHLGVEHINFFTKWSKLLLTEHFDNERFEDVIGRICKTSGKADRFFTSGTVRRLRLLKTKTVGNSISGECEFQSWFIPDKPTDQSNETLLSISGLSVGDLVIVSSDDCRLLGIDLATIVPTEDLHDIENSVCNGIPSQSDYKKSVISLTSTRPFPDRIKLFRIDRYVTMKTVQLNLSNLIGLMQNSTLGQVLRELIIDGRMPNTSKTISKRIVKEIRPILKPLNVNQRAAILQTLFSQDYILIKGYPGSGKTETLTALLRVLILLKKKVLVAAHTHSAVDNLLLRLHQTGETRIIRLGQVNRIHPNLKNYSLESKLNTFLKSNEKLKTDATDYVHSIMMDAAVVGCTALTASGGNDLRHAALTYQKFDVILIDEASQLMCPTSLGPLLCLRTEQESNGVRCCRFVLVGDPYQLPPLVRSQKAKNGGLDQSLFTLLLNYSIGDTYERKTIGSSIDYSNKEHIIELTIQYRMNSNILTLTNYLAYQNKMSCANSVVAQSTIQLKPGVSDKNLEKLPLWIKRVISPLLSDSLLLLDTKKLDCCVSSSNESHATNSNPTEAQLILYIIKKSVDVLTLNSKDIGIIAPYRAQVSLLKNKIKENSFEDIEVNTVDQFQGRDKRLILLCLTNCPSMLKKDKNEYFESNRIHLLEDLPRLTVALTRAQHKLIIVGCTGYHNPNTEDIKQNTKLGELYSCIKTMLGGYEILPIDTVSLL